MSEPQQELQSTVNDQETEERIFNAFLASNHATDDEKFYESFYEHDQWWILHKPSGRTWSVVDAEGGSSIDGFDFELITEGEEEHATSEDDDADLDAELAENPDSEFDPPENDL